MTATKEELEEMAKDLFKRLGGMRTKDGRIVRALLAVWKAAELNTAVQQSAQADDCPSCAGSGKKEIGGMLLTCLACDGTGIRR